MRMIPGGTGTTVRSRMAARTAGALLAALLLLPASCAEEKRPAEKQLQEVAPAPREVKVLYATDFESGRDLYSGGKYDGHWQTNEKDAKLSVEPPLATGNDSKQALTYRTLKVRHLASCEVPLRRTVVEPQGWDGALSFRFYNGGFKEVYAMYLTLFPSDANNYRCYFDAPEGRWVELDLPLDKFLYLNQRPRRGPTNQLEAIVFVAHDPESGDAVFQVDDVKLYRLKQADPPLAKPKPPLPQGVMYRQDFDDPNDFDLESYYAFTYDCKVRRIEHDPETTGRPVAEGGCLKIEGVKVGKQVKAGRSRRFPGKDTVMEFDLLAKGIRSFRLIGRCLSRKDLWLNPGEPEEGRWKHYRVAARDFQPLNLVDTPGAKGEHGKGETFWSLMFRFFPDEKKTGHYILVDNLVFRQVTGENGAGQ